MIGYLPVREGGLARLISRAASTIIVDYTTRLQMEVTRGCVEEILQEGNRVVLEQGIMSLTGQEIVEAGLADRLGNCVDYLLDIVGVEPVRMGTRAGRWPEVGGGGQGEHALHPPAQAG